MTKILATTANVALFAGCVAAAGAIYADNSGVPNPNHVADYAVRLFGAAVKKLKDA